jgi:hypothetical protein
MGAALALCVMAGFAGQASAGLREYCDSYARDVANRKVNGSADVLAGAEKRVTVLDASVSRDPHKRAYYYAYNRCMDNHESHRTGYQAYDGDACARKYRSFNRQNGKYKTSSGQWKPCRL